MLDFKNFFLSYNYEMEDIIDYFSYMTMNKEEHDNYSFFNKLEHCKWYNPEKLDYLVIPKKGEEILKSISYNRCIQDRDLEGLVSWYIHNRRDIPYIDRLGYYLARNDLGDRIKKYELYEIKKLCKKNKQIEKMEDDQRRKAIKRKEKEERQKLKIINKEVFLYF